MLKFQVIGYKGIFFLIALVLIWPMDHYAQKSLNYQQIASGLGTPDFEEGNTDFVFDDINMDGHADILTVGDHGSPMFNSGEHGIIVWFGDGEGSFTNYMNGDFGYGGIATGDVNNDGFKDVGFGVHHNYSGTNFGDQLNEVALGDGTGMNWQPWDQGLSTNGETWGMFGTAFADFNNNGLLDLVSVSFGCCSGVHVYLNKGDGSWEQSFGFMGGNSDFLVRTCDINNDGYMDFIAGHESGTAYFGDGTGNFNKNDNGLPGAGSAYRRGIDIARFKTSGSYGLSYINSNGGVNVFVWEDNIETWINLSGNLPASGSYDLLQLCDMNNDGFIDVMAYGSRHFQLWLGDEAGNWTVDAAMITPGEPGEGNAIRAGADLDHNGFPDLLFLASKLSGDWIQVEKNFLYVYKEGSVADELSIKPLFPAGFENFYPGSVQFIEWLAEVPAGLQTVVDIEISASGTGGPWWMLAEAIPNNGKHQWIVPDFGSEQVHLKFTVREINGTNFNVHVTEYPFTIYGDPTLVPGIQTEANQVSIFPNPGNDFIRLSNPQSVEEFKLSDLTGRCLLQVTSDFNRISTDRLAPGVYPYQVITKNQDLLSGKWIRLAE